MMSHEKKTGLAIVGIMELLFIAGTSVLASIDFPPNPLVKPGWKLVVHDEFDGGDGKLNPELWIDGYFPGRFGDSYDSPRMASNCEFRWEKDIRFVVLMTRASQPRGWVAGMATFNRLDWHKCYENRAISLQHRFSQKFGYFEVRSRHPVAVTGSHAAWWILDTQAVGAEIDVFEDSAHGGPNFHTKAVGPILDNRGADYPMTREEKDVAWRVYGMEIHETGIRFFLNNELIHERSADWSQIKAWAHILSLYSKQPVADNEFHIDYFRVYERAAE